MTFVGSGLVVDFHDGMGVKEDAFVKQGGANPIGNLFRKQATRLIVRIDIAVHVVTDGFYDRNMVVLQLGEFVFDVGMVEEFVHVADNHEVGMSTRFFPAVVFYLVVVVVAEAVRVEFDKRGVGSGADDIDGMVGRAVVVDGEVIDKAFIMVEHEGQYLFLVPADGIVMDDRVVYPVNLFVELQLEQQ